MVEGRQDGARLHRQDRRRPRAPAQEREYDDAAQAQAEGRPRRDRSSRRGSPASTPRLVKRSEYDFDSQAMRPYLPYSQVVKGVLDVSSKMFGVTYKPVTNAPVWHPSVECYEIKDGDRLVGPLLPRHAPAPGQVQPRRAVRHPHRHRRRPDARGRAGVQLPGRQAGDPGLCTIDDVRRSSTSSATCSTPSSPASSAGSGIGGIRTERDFVEAPSQMLEEWMWDPKVLADVRQAPRDRRGRCRPRW